MPTFENLGPRDLVMPAGWAAVRNREQAMIVLQLVSGVNGIDDSLDKARDYWQVSRDVEAARKYLWRAIDLYLAARRLGAPKRQQVEDRINAYAQTAGIVGTLNT